MPALYADHSDNGCPRKNFSRGLPKFSRSCRD
jgi:hypothetical protein